MCVCLWFRFLFLTSALFVLFLFFVFVLFFGGVDQVVRYLVKEREFDQVYTVMSFVYFRLSSTSSSSPLLEKLALECLILVMVSCYHERDFASALAVGKWQPFRVRPFSLPIYRFANRLLTSIGGAAHNHAKSLLVLTWCRSLSFSPFYVMYIFLTALSSLFCC